jgi:hypothetical protein
MLASSFFLILLLDVSLAAYHIGISTFHHPEQHTLAVLGLEDFFFQLCWCVSFLVSGGK